MSLLMPFSPLDAIFSILPELRKAGKPKRGDNVITVNQRMADVLTPVIKRIQEEAIKSYLYNNSPKSTN